jgi:hypothetical protein
MSNEYDTGDIVILDVTFQARDSGGVLVPTDPTLGRSCARRQSAKWQTVTTPAPVKDTTGVYHVDVDVTLSGTYHYRWEGTGAAQGAEEGRFYVRPSGVLA